MAACRKPCPRTSCLRGLAAGGYAVGSSGGGVLRRGLCGGAQAPFPLPGSFRDESGLAAGMRRNFFCLRFHSCFLSRFLTLLFFSSLRRGMRAYIYIYIAFRRCFQAPCGGVCGAFRVERVAFCESGDHKRTLADHIFRRLLAEGYAGAYIYIYIYIYTPAYPAASK